jgi:beta-phosphoglucomutase family hydrolase
MQRTGDLMAAARSSRKHPEASRGAAVKLLRRTLDAVIFDMDGVVTRTAVLHAAAWKQLFDEFLQARAGEPGSFRPFDTEADYKYYVDGKPRYDGVASFLASRGISLPYGSPDDPPDADTVCGLGNRKDAFFQQMLKRDGVEVYESTVRLIWRLKDAGIKTGIFSASRNAGPILAAAGIHRLFDAKVDGLDAEKLSLPGKPSPETLLELARRLGASPARTAVVEDAIAGVQAGRAGDFALVIGVNRSGKPGTLLANGADVEVSDLSQVELSVDGAGA